MQEYCQKLMIHVTAFQIGGLHWLQTFFTFGVANNTQGMIDGKRGKRWMCQHASP
jgi:hypothetical protein